MAGGRYDGLVRQMGGPPTPAVGWAAGIERLAMLLAERAGGARPGRGGAGRRGGAAGGDSACCRRCAEAGVRAEMAYRGNLKRRMERANRIGARVAVILGDEEVARGVAQVKDLDAGGQGRWRWPPAGRRALLG